MRKSHVGVGYVARVDKFQWAEIRNIKLKNGNGVFRRSDSGSISKGGTLTVTLVLKDGQVLARYKTKWNKMAEGAELPTGAMIQFASIDVLREMNRVYRHMSLAEKRLES